ncbi:60S acidic ribosomal protein [Mycena venus]|uniref:60S acidic ribosomal protein n=1 Tax=Mycena venus TaxID=2733690 RepID=A0A8H7CPU5_9AGAR|nr:60S acidic ribosomal protein [Mycena venus]
MWPTETQDKFWGRCRNPLWYLTTRFFLEQSNLSIRNSILMTSADLAATYAALILADAESEITSEKILALTSAAGVDIEPIWATLLSKALEGKNVKEMLSTIGVGSGPVATGGVATTPAQDDAAKPADDAPAADDGNDSDSDDGLFSGGLFD